MVLQACGNQNNPKDLYKDIFSAEYTDIVLRSISRNKAVRLRKSGWQLREKETLTGLREDELPIIWQEKTPFSGYGKAVAS